MDAASLDLWDTTRLLAGLLTKLIDRFEDPDLFADTKPEGALALHQGVKVLSGLVRDLAAEADRLLIATMGGERKALVDGKTVEIRRAYKRFEWDHPLLAERVAIVALDGEVLPETKTVIDAWLKACRPEWRITGLKDMGIDGDEFCSKELQRATVQVIGGA